MSSNKVKTKTEETTVQFARPEDIPQIVAFVFNTYEDISLNSSPPSFPKIVLEITNAVIQGIVLVQRNEEDNKFIDGVIVLKHSSAWWSEEQLLVQLFFYVKPEARGTGVFTNLLDAAEEYGKIDNLTIGQSIVGKDAQRKANVLKRKGYTQIGVEMIKEY